MRATAFLSLALLAAACGGDATSPSAQPTEEEQVRGGEQPQQAPSSPDQVAIEDVLRAQHDAVRRNDGAAFAAAFVPDVFVFGPFAAQSLAGRDATVAAISETFGRFLDAQSTVTSQGATYGFTADRQGAWVFDVVAVASRGTQTTFHVTTVLAKDGANWKVVAQAWTTPVADDLALPLAAQGGWPDPAAVTETVGDGSQPVRQRVTSFLAGGPWPAGARTDSLMIGTAPGEIRRGDGEIAPVIAGARSAGVSFALLGGVTTRLVAGGALAYAAYGAHLSVPHQGQTVRLPVRALDVYVRDGADYRLVVTHVSLGAPG
ncbi:MAG: nuclear transport factor 2 family protein [Deltaproteobacteria bacterium]|nr:nuclear transport factor 2 family protein [Deltaproteobacteria bacterium]